MFAEQGIITKPKFNYPRYTLYINGLEIKYWDEGHGKPIVLLHGIGCSIEYWAWTLPRWAKEFRVIAVDLPGFGQSSIPRLQRGESVLTVANGLMQRIFEELELDRPLLIGHSMGAGIAVQYALAHPNNYSGLVLINAMGFGSEIDPLSRILSLPIVGPILFQPRRSLIPRFLKAVQPVEGLDELAEITYRYFHRPGVKAWHLSLMRQGISLSGQKIQFPAAALATLKAPTLIIWGKIDPIFPVKHATHAHEHIPNSTLHTLDQVGHNPHVEKAKVVTELVRDFDAQLAFM